MTNSVGLPSVDRFVSSDRDALDADITSLNSAVQALYGLRCNLEPISRMVGHLDDDGRIRARVAGISHALTSTEAWLGTLAVALSNIRNGYCPSCAHQRDLHGEDGCEERTVTHAGAPTTYGPCPCRKTYGQE
jgi:hypothetical protein